MQKPKILCLIGSIVQIVGVVIGVIIFQYVWSGRVRFIRLVDEAANFGNPVIFPLLFSIGVILSAISLFGTKQPLWFISSILTIFFGITFLAVWADDGMFSPEFRAFSIIWFITDILLVVAAITVRDRSKVPMIFFILSAGLSVVVNISFGFWFLKDEEDALQTIADNPISSAAILNVYLILLVVYSLIKAISFLSVSFINSTEKRFKIVKEAEDTLTIGGESDFDSFIGSPDGFDSGSAKSEKPGKNIKKDKKSKKPVDEWDDF
jgi:hypothetical protein